MNFNGSIQQEISITRCLISPQKATFVNRACSLEADSIRYWLSEKYIKQSAGGSPMASRGNDIPLVYVYLGGKIPNYVQHSLSINRRGFQGPIVLLTDIASPGRFKGVDVQTIDSWYNPKEFERFRTESSVDKLFRAGFWLHAMERFFVLHQYMRFLGEERIFHAELDVMLFRPSTIAEDLDAQGCGLFVPTEPKSIGVASLIYVNSVDCLSNFLEFALRNANLGSEMSILGAFVSDRPDCGRPLPSEQLLNKTSYKQAPNAVELGDRLVDCAAIGQWLLGQDPRNVQGASWSKYVGRIELNFNDVQIAASLSGKSLRIRSSEGTWKDVLALHVHSKTFKRLRIPGILWFYAIATVLPFRIPITQIWPGVLGFFQKLLLSSYVVRLPNSVRFKLENLVLSITRHSPVILSNRQRQRLITFVRPPRRSRKKSSFAITAVESIVSCHDCADGSCSSWSRFNSSYCPKKEAAIFLDALNKTEPTVYSFPGDDILLDRELFHHGRQILFLSDNKAYEATRHALAYWSHLDLNNRLSFTSSAQLINPEYVRSMFPGGEQDIELWLALALQNSGARASAFQSYGTWLYSCYPRLAKLATYPTESRT